ncbi:MAG: hypothetical protein HQL37_14165 [Alphaproteobacteria bacterium]|nr:hypothetical protein [Alphaproteobacteria bacterium]
MDVRSEVKSVTSHADGQLEVAEDLIITDAGTEVGRSTRRRVLAPGADLTAEPSQVQAVAGVLWTTEVVAAWQAAQAVRFTPPAR